MNRINLISCYWLLKKTLVITTNLNNPESASGTQLDTKIAFIFYKYLLPLKGHCYYILKLVSTLYELCFNWPAPSREHTFIFHPKNWWTAGQQNVGIFSHSFLLFFFNFKTLFDGLLQKKINKSKNIL